jgi:hypothetical protein
VKYIATLIEVCLRFTGLVNEKSLSLPYMGLFTTLKGETDVLAVA